MLNGSRERAPGALPPLHAQAKLPNACKDGAAAPGSRHDWTSQWTAMQAELC